MTVHPDLHIYTAKSVGGYYYFAGNGFFAGVSLEALKAAKNDSTIVDDGIVLKDENTSASMTNPNNVLWVDTADQIYAMDGRDTR